MHHQESGPKTTRPINEIDRVAVLLPRGTTFYNDQRYIAVCWDMDVQGNPCGQILGSNRRSLPFLARYELLNALCRDRAKQTVDGSLRVNDQIITPERYLGLWRAAIAHPVTAEQFTEQYGHLLLVLRSPVDLLRGRRTPWASSPFRHFEDFEAAYRRRIEYHCTAGIENFEIALDLREPDAARDAFYAASFIYSAGLEEHGLIDIQLQTDGMPETDLCKVTVQPELLMEVAA